MDCQMCSNLVHEEGQKYSRREEDQQECCPSDVRRTILRVCSLCHTRHPCNLNDPKYMVSRTCCSVDPNLFLALTQAVGLLMRTSVVRLHHARETEHKQFQTCRANVSQFAFLS